MANGALGFTNNIAGGGTVTLGGLSRRCGDGEQRRHRRLAEEPLRGRSRSEYDICRSTLTNGSGTLGLGVTGGNLTLLSGNINYTGATTVNGGTLTVQDTTSFGSTTSGSKQRHARLNAQHYRLYQSIPYRLSSNLTSSGVINVNNGSGGLNGGWSTMTGTNNLTGTININSGVLATDGGGTVTGSATVNLAAGRDLCRCTQLLAGRLVR